MTVKPIMDWSSQEAFDGAVVWWTRLDQRYQIEVVRISERSADLRIFDHAHSDVLLHEEPVLLAYGAPFGPDMDDVAQWRDIALKFVDNH